MDAKKRGIALLALSALLLFAAAGIAQQPGEVKDAHGKLGVPCSGCHGEGTPSRAPAREACLKCHVSYAAVAKRTEKLKPNPHASHDGDVACSQCHSTHGVPRLYCNGCHSFQNFKLK